MRRRLQGARVARLATADPTGRPHLVPIVFALVEDLIVTVVDEKPKRTKRLQRLENVRANPLVTVLVDHYEEDWSRLWWVRVRGDARVHEEGPERERALEALAGKYAQYRDAAPHGPAILIEAQEWLGWSASG
ncbi:MAG TPA: TIGR03668 family PPOX class F420-dependent oxidoreductase [Actinomycetota bacterium]